MEHAFFKNFLFLFYSVKSQARAIALWPPEDLKSGNFFLSKAGHLDVHLGLYAAYPASGAWSSSAEDLQIAFCPFRNISF